MKKTILLCILLIFTFYGCENKNSSIEVNSEINSETESNWQTEYVKLLKNPSEYYESGHSSEEFVLKDIDNNGVPELIIIYWNGVEGGNIFANIYTYTNKINRLGHQINMYYKTFFTSDKPQFCGLFVEGGRESNFYCNYWTINDGIFVEEKVWETDDNTDEFSSENMLSIKQLTQNSELFIEATENISRQTDFNIYYSIKDDIDLILNYK